MDELGKFTEYAENPGLRFQIFSFLELFRKFISGRQ